MAGALHSVETAQARARSGDLREADQTGAGFAAMNLARADRRKTCLAALGRCRDLTPGRASRNPRRPFGPGADLISGAQITSLLGRTFGDVSPSGRAGAR